MHDGFCRCGREIKQGENACERCRVKHDRLDAEIARKFPPEHTPLMFEVQADEAKSGGGK